MTPAAPSKAYAATRLTYASRVYEIGDEITHLGEVIVSRLLDIGDASATKPKPVDPAE